MFIDCICIFLVSELLYGFTNSTVSKDPSNLIIHLIQCNATAPEQHLFSKEKKELLRRDSNLRHTDC